MGFVWSSPVSPLSAPLLKGEPATNLRCADLLLVTKSDFEINFDCDMWSHVGLVFIQNSRVFVFCDGEVLSLLSFRKRHTEIFVRRAHCRRPSNFQTLVSDAVQQVAEWNNKDIENRQGFCVFSVLVQLQLTSPDGQTAQDLHPCHFSHDTKRLKLSMYSKNYRLNF